MIAEDSWTTVGAQLYPAPPERLSDQAYADWQAQNDLVYVSGEGDDRLVIVAPPDGSDEGC